MKIKSGIDGDKYRYTESFIFYDKSVTAKTIKAIVCEYKKNGCFKKMVAYCLTSKEAEQICNALNKME